MQLRVTIMTRVYVKGSEDLRSVVGRVLQGRGNIRLCGIGSAGANFAHRAMVMAGRMMRDTI